MQNIGEKVRGKANFFFFFIKMNLDIEHKQCGFVNPNLCSFCSLAGYFVGNSSLAVYFWFKEILYNERSI